MSDITDTKHSLANTGNGIIAKRVTLQQDLIATGNSDKDGANKTFNIKVQKAGTPSNDTPDTFMTMTNSNSSDGKTSNGDISNIDISKPLYISSNRQSNSDTSDGALVVNGGVGIVGNLNIGGVIGIVGSTRIYNATESTSKTTGSLIVDGGVGIMKNLHVGGDFRVDGTTTYLNVEEVDIKDNKIALNAASIVATLSTESFTIDNNEKLSSVTNSLLISAIPTANNQYAIGYVNDNTVSDGDNGPITTSNFNAYQNTNLQITVDKDTGVTSFSTSSGSPNINNFLTGKHYYLVWKENSMAQTYYYHRIWNPDSESNNISLNSNESKDSGILIYTASDKLNQCFIWDVSAECWKFKNTSGNTDGSEYENVRVATTPDHANDATSKNYVDTITTVPTSGSTEHTNITTALVGVHSSYSGCEIDGYIGSSGFSIVWVTKSDGTKKVVAIQGTANDGYTARELN